MEAAALILILIHSSSPSIFAENTTLLARVVSFLCNCTNSQSVSMVRKGWSTLEVTDSWLKIIRGVLFLRWTGTGCSVADRTRRIRQDGARSSLGEPIEDFVLQTRISHSGCQAVGDARRHCTWHTSEVCRLAAFVAEGAKTLESWTHSPSNVSNMVQ